MLMQMDLICSRLIPVCLTLKRHVGHFDCFHMYVLNIFVEFKITSFTEDKGNVIIFAFYGHSHNDHTDFAIVKLTHFQVLLHFLKRYLNTINALLPMLGIYHER